MANNNESFKLRTRRFIAWGFGGLAIVTISFIAIWGAITAQVTLVTLAVGALIAIVTSIITYYFKKTSEE